MSTVNSALDEIMKLDYTSREIILEILQKRQSEARRDEIAKKAKQTLKEYRSGKIEPLTVEEAISRLESL